jgi:hypothetical protein
MKLKISEDRLFIVENCRKRSKKFSEEEFMGVARKTFVDFLFKTLNSK